MPKKYDSGLERSTKESSLEIISLLGFVKRVGLIAYACFKYPFAKEDVYIDFRTGKVTLER